LLQEKTHFGALRVGSNYRVDEGNKRNGITGRGITEDLKSYNCPWCDDRSDAVDDDGNDQQTRDA
jgi:hypothetical protein